jgi:hypothetical protein
MRAMLRGTVAVAIVWVAAGCGPAEAPPAEEPPLALFDTALVGDPPPVAAARRIELLDPGAEPRAELRYRPTGAGERSTWEGTVAIRVSLAGAEIYAESTAGQLDYVARRAAEETPEGATEVPYELDLDAVRGFAIAETLPRDLVAAFATSAESGEIESRIGVTVGPRGPLSEGPGDLPSFFLLPLPPLPEEALGVGARWRVTEEPLRHILVVSEYTLEEAGGDRWRISTRETIEAPAVNIPGLTVESAAYEATESLLVEPGRVLAAEVEGSATVRARLRIPTDIPTAFPVPFTELAFEISAEYRGARR